jgi:hypothetical protein
VLGTHQGLDKGADVQPPYRVGYPPVEVISGEGDRGHLRTLQVDPRHHLRKPQPPLRQGKHPPAMDGGDLPRGGKPSVSQLLQGLQKGLEILLFLARGPLAPVAAGGSHHSLGKRREPPIVVPEAKGSAEKRWVHRSQWGSIPKNPSQTATKMAACAMELGLRLCSSTP